MFDGKLVPQQKQPPEYSMKKGGLGNFTKFTGKNLCQSLFFDKVAGLRPATLLKKRLFCEISKNTFFTEHIRVTSSNHG